MPTQRRLTSSGTAGGPGFQGKSPRTERIRDLGQCSVMIISPSDLAARQRAEQIKNALVGKCKMINIRFTGPTMDIASFARAAQDRQIVLLAMDFQREETVRFLVDRLREANPDIYIGIIGTKEETAGKKWVDFVLIVADPKIVFEQSSTLPEALQIMLSNPPLGIEEKRRGSGELSEENVQRLLEMLPLSGGVLVKQSDWPRVKAGLETRGLRLMEIDLRPAVEGIPIDAWRIVHTAMGEMEFERKRAGGGEDTYIFEDRQSQLPENTVLVFHHPPSTNQKDPAYGIFWTVFKQVRGPVRKIVVYDDAVGRYGGYSPPFNECRHFE